MFLSGLYHCAFSYLNRNISLQISLFYLISFILVVDVACGNKEKCNLAALIAVSEITAVCLTLTLCFSVLSLEFSLVSSAKVV